MSGPPFTIDNPTRDLGALPTSGASGDRQRQIFCGDIDIRIGRDGTWFYHGSPIGRKPLVKLFASVLRRESNGEFWLVTPAERCRIKVDDTPFTAVEVNAAGQGREQILMFRTNLDEEVTADLDHPIRVSHNPDTDEPSPYILIRGGLEARILRPAFYAMVELAELRKDSAREIYGVWSKGTFFPLEPADPTA